MRRLLSYLALCGAMLLGVGVSVSPVVQKMNTDVAYSEGKTLYFKASSYNISNAEETTVGGYTDFLNEYDYTSSGQRSIEFLKDVVTSRLNNWKMSEYKVEIEGYDTLKVTLRAANNSATSYQYLQQYLSFSGKHLELDVTAIADPENDPTKESWKTMIEGQVAEIKYIEQSGFSVPVVAIGVNNTEDFLAMVDYCNENTKEEDHEKGTEAQTTSIVVWANRAPDDKYELASKDANVASRVLKVQTTANDNAVWYANDTDRTNKDNPSFQLIPASAALTEGGFDPSKSQEAYEAAYFLANMMNASALGTNGEQEYMLTYTHTEDAPATVESLVSTSSILSISLSKTLISVIVVFVLLGVVLCLFDRMLGVMELTGVAGVTFLTFLTFVGFGAQFNIAALLGLAVAAGLAAFGAIYYSAKLKNEVYKGRTLKKAHVEASKKAALPILDVSLVAIIIGIFVFVFAGDIASKLGLMMVIGGAIALAWNLIVTRILGWLLTNDSTVNSKFGALLHIDKDKIPNLLKEEKQTYFGPYEKKDFTKGKFGVGIFTGALLIAGIVCVAVFGGKNYGDPYNDAALKETSTVLHIDVKSTEPGKISILQFESEDKLMNDLDDYSDIFHNVKIDDKVFAKNVKSIELSETPHSVFDSQDGENGTTYYYFYYRITLNKAYDLDKSNYKIDYGASGQYDKHVIGYLSEGFEQFFIDQVYNDTTAYSVEFKTVTPEIGAPYLSDLLISMAIGFAVATAYLMLRYRPSRGLVAGVFSFGAAFIGIAFFVIARIPVAPVFAVGAIAAGLLVLVSSIYILAQEKELFRESHDRDKTSYAARSAFLTRANSLGAGPYLFFVLNLFYIGVLLFGIGPFAYSNVFLSLIIGCLFGTGLMLSCLTPCSIFIAKYLSKIKIKPIKRKKKKNSGGNLMKKKKGAEPEEAIFIGIND